MRSAESKRLDMLHGPIWSKLPQFALPVAATAILEQLFNASDVAVVGNFSTLEEAEAVIASGALDEWTHNKAIQKAVESRRIPAEQKDRLRAMKRRP